VLVHASELDCPGAGGTAVLRDVSGAYYVGDDFQSRGNGVSIRLLGTNIVRSFRKSEVFSLAPMAAHTQAEAQIIGTRQRRGEPALVLPLTEKQRAARRRSDFENGKRPKAEK
jgi:hypothetical protein